MIALCIAIFVVAGTIVACALMRGAHLNDPPERFDPILRATPKERDRA